MRDHTLVYLKDLLAPFTEPIRVATSIDEIARDEASAYRVSLSAQGGSYTFDLVPHAPYLISSNGDLFVEEAHRGQGLARALVDVREAVCCALGIDTIVIGQNGNDSFWAHFGYEPVAPPVLPRYRSLADPLGLIEFEENHERLAEPRHKILQPLTL